MSIHTIDYLLLEERAMEAKRKALIEQAAKTSFESYNSINCLPKGSSSVAKRAIWITQMMQAHNILKSITIDEVLDAVRVVIEMRNFGPPYVADIIEAVRTRIDAPAKAEEQSEKTCGWYKKFTITRTDGKSEAGKKHDGCEYFVLDLDHDKHAPAALRAYAESCTNDNPELYYDILNKVGDVPYRDPEHLGVKPKAEQGCGAYNHSQMNATQDGCQNCTSTPLPGESTQPSYVAYMAMTPAEREACVQKAEEIPQPQIHDAILAKMVSDLVLTVNTLTLRVNALEKGAK